MSDNNDYFQLGFDDALEYFEVRYSDNTEYLQGYKEGSKQRNTDE